MKQILVSGLAHPLAPYFVLHQLMHGHDEIICLDDSAGLAGPLAQRLRTVLLAREAAADIASAAPLLARLRLTAAPAVAGPRHHVRFLSASELPAPAPADATERERLDGDADALSLVFDRHDLPRERTVEHCMQRIEQAVTPALRAGTRLRLYCMGVYVHDILQLHDPVPAGGAPLEFLVDHATALVGALRRRVPGYLARWPLGPRQRRKQELRCMGASQAAACIAAAGDPAQPRRHFVVGAHAIRFDAVLDDVVQAGGGIVAPVPVPGTGGKAAALLDSVLAHAAAYANAEWSDLDAAQHGEFKLHQVAAPAPDLGPTLRAAKERDAVLADRMRQGLTSLEGLAVRTGTRNGLRYYVHGSGDQVLLVVNAFGLTLDFWHMLFARLGKSMRVIAIERPATTEEAIPLTYYASADYLATWLADCRAVLSAEGVRACHVAGWCSGAKYALELAHAHPDAVLSLSLLAPSFAGMEGFAGQDSAYEKSLHTMCKLVDKMPKTAGTMAASMLQMMEKNSRDIERFDPLRSDAVDVLELADAHHLPALYRPFSSAGHLVEFSRQLMHFRAHDVRSLLCDADLHVPVMLVTGTCDTTTSNDRARDLCRRLQDVTGFEVEGASHYLIHQEYEIVAGLLLGFMRDGLDVQTDCFRVRRSLLRRLEDERQPARADREEQRVPG